MKRIILLTLVLTCRAAQATEWVLVTKTTNEKTFLVDASRIKSAGGVRRAWVKIVEVPHRVMTENGQYVSFSIARWAFNCSEETARPETGTEYYENGTAHLSQDMRTTMTPVTPDSVISILLQFICSWKPK